MKEADPAELLADGLAKMGLAADERQLERIRIYLHELHAWNPTHGLVRAEGSQIIVRHLFDSLAGLPVVRKYTSGSVTDLGSGGGFPGIPLAIFQPDGVRFCLVERSRRKADFLRNVVPLLGLGDRIEIIESDMKALKRSFQLIVFRGFARLPEIAPHLRRLLSPGGIVVAYKGRLASVEEEVAHFRHNPLGFSVESICPVQVPYLSAERYLVVLKAIG